MDDTCRQYCDSDLTGSFFMLGTGTNRRTFILERDDDMAKFWLKPVRLHNSGGFSRSEIAKLATLVTERQDELLEAWNAYFKD